MPDFGFAARLAAAALARGALRFAARVALAREPRFSLLFFFLLFFALRNVAFFACLRAADFAAVRRRGVFRAAVDFAVTGLAVADVAAGASTPRS